MNNRKLHLSVLAGVLALALTLGLFAGFMPTTASAATSSELKVQLDALKQQKSQLDAELSGLKGQLAETNSEIEAMVLEKNIIDQEIFVLYQQITNINNQIATYSMLIADKQEELTAAEEKYDELLEQNRDRIQAMEEEGSITYWSVLFQANSFADLLDRVNMVQEIAASDKRRLDELNAAAVAVAENKAALQEEKVGLEETKTTLNATQADLEVKREEADQLLADLVATGMEYEQLVALSEIAQSQLMTDIANKENQYDAAIYEEWLATSIPPTTLPLAPSQTEPTEATKPGDEDSDKDDDSDKEEETKPSTNEGWKVPINYTAFTSPFGEREAPTAGASTNHQGVDLAAPSGTPIYATRSGTVSTAAYSSSAGYYVQIDHGDGYKSIYMHMTHYVVSSGQSVKQGEVIGYCGSTGVSTGSHLHFGISLNGTYVNPANYIPI